MLEVVSGHVFCLYICMKGRLCYKITSWLRHQLTAWNTGGEGVHSPSLFYIIRMLVYDRNPYYCFSAIEKRREAMLRAPKLIHFTDFGTGQSGQRLVCDIAKNELESPQIAQMLFRLVVYLNSNRKEPLHILELGTSLGLTTAYLKLANPQNEVVTLEGCHDVAQMAQLNWSKLGIEDIRCVEGNIDVTLPDTLFTHSARVWDVVYIDANHTQEATLRYYEMIQPNLHPKSIVIIDDIYHSPDMEQAWLTLCQRSEVTSSLDFYRCGWLFFDPNYLRKNYRLRI